MQHATQSTVFLAQGAHIVAVNCSRKTVVGAFAVDWHNSDSIVRLASVSVSGLGIAIQQTRIGEQDRFNWRYLDSIVRISSVSVFDLDVAIQHTQIGELDRFYWRYLDSIVRISSVSVFDFDVAIPQTQIGQMDRLDWHDLDSECDGCFSFG